MYIYIWDCGDHQLRLICAQVRHHSPRRYVYTGPGEVSSLVTDPPGTPVTPCVIILVIIRKGEEGRKEKERSFTSI